MQWAMTKWQQLASCISYHRAKDLEVRIRLREISLENRRLRKTLRDYHRRGMFVLDSNQTQIVQSRQNPGLRVKDYESVNHMLEASYFSAGQRSPDWTKYAPSSTLLDSYKTPRKTLASLRAHATINNSSVGSCPDGEDKAGDMKVEDL